jgi:hypothetical protein
MELKHEVWEKVDERQLGQPVEGGLDADAVPYDSEVLRRALKIVCSLRASNASRP